MPDGAEHDWPVTCCSEPSLGVVKSRWFPSDLVGQKDDESESVGRQGTVVSCEANRLLYTWRWTSCLLRLVWDIDFFVSGVKGKFLFPASKMPYIHTGLHFPNIYIYTRHCSIPYVGYFNFNPSMIL